MGLGFFFLLFPHQNHLAVSFRLQSIQLAQICIPPWSNKQTTARQSLLPSSTLKHQHSFLSISDGRGFWKDLDDAVAWLWPSTWDLLCANTSKPRGDDHQPDPLSSASAGMLQALMLPPQLWPERQGTPKIPAGTRLGKTR